MSLVCCSCTEREKAAPTPAGTYIWAREAPGPGRGSVPRQQAEGTEYRCGARRRTGS